MYYATLHEQHNNKKGTRHNLESFCKKNLKINFNFQKYVKIVLLFK